MIDISYVKNKLKSDGYDIEQVWSNDECLQLLVFNSEMLSVFNGINGRLTIGVYVDVPHTGPGLMKFHAAIKRIANSSIIILNDNDSLVKSETPKFDPDNSLYNLIKSATKHMQLTLSQWVVARWAQLRTITASLDECLKTIKLTNGAAQKLIDIDKVLIAHNLVGPADTWQMFRQQANTPYNRLSLINIIAEYANNLIGQDKIDMMCKAGNMLRNNGDLECRPVWVTWDNIDFSDRQYFIQ